MRPVSIEVEGFSAYRSRVEVDFAGVDFFSITGPTGSGKSSLVDAMIFALFGRVPRLGGNSVAPAITAGADRARVRFDFEVDGDVYTAVRLAQRTSSGGATVKEARLQKGDLPVASGADEVTGAVEDLLKLTFDDFTRTVVLPQGDFARFLTATKAERQGLLRNLLGMDVYTTVRELAKTRAAVASDRAEGANHALEGLEMASAEEIEAMVARRDGLNALAEAMPGHEEELADLDKTVTETQRVVDSVSDRIERLSAIEEPPRLADLDQLVETARSALVDAAAAVESAYLAVEETTAALAAMPGQDTIEMWVKSRERLAEMGTRLAESKVDEARSLAQEAQTRLDDAAGALSAARGRLEEARTRHAAHLLAATLVVGEECPVCAREVAAIPISETPGGLDELESEVERLGAVVEAARADAEWARENFTRIETGAQALDEQVAALRAELETAPESAELARIETDRKGLVEELERRRQELVALQEEVKKGHFREDLYYRLNVMSVALPPLRERRSDIPLLIAHYIDSFNTEFRKKIKGVTPAAMSSLQAYAWRGNVRELRNAVERAMLLAEGRAIAADDLRLGESPTSGSGREHGSLVKIPPTGVPLEDIERQALVEALKMSNWIQKDAAELLSISPRVMNYKIKTLGIEFPRGRRAAGPPAPPAPPIAEAS